MTDLYNERIDAMKAREHVNDPVFLIWFRRRFAQNDRNTDRLAAYQRKRPQT